MILIPFSVGNGCYLARTCSNSNDMETSLGPRLASGVVLVLRYLVVMRSNSCDRISE